MRHLILLTGASSSPGYKTLNSLAKKRANIVAVYNTHPVSAKSERVEVIKADLVRDSGKLVSEYKPDIVIHLAALGHVDTCEEDKTYCYRVNTVATRELLRGAYRIGSKILYLSTDYVFDGRRGFYNENDTPDPVNYYGLTKLLGEEVTLSLGGLVVRTSAIYGLGPGRPNFGKTVIERLSRGEEIKAFTDQWLSPTLNTFLGNALSILALDKNIYGVLHVAGPRLSRYEFAIKLAETFGFNKNLIQPSSISDVNFIAPRPRDSSLVVDRAIEITGIPLTDIDAALSQLKKEWIQHKSTNL